MNKTDLTLYLTLVKDGKQRWAERITEFNAGIETIMTRLLHEAMAARMSPEQVADATGFTPKRVRQMLRERGLNPRDGKTVLSQQAAEALANNAALLGIEPSEMDLMSPLAYLPMGSEMRKQIATDAASQVHEMDETVSGNPALKSLLADLRREYAQYPTSDADLHYWDMYEQADNILTRIEAIL